MAAGSASWVCGKLLQLCILRNIALRTRDSAAEKLLWEHSGHLHCIWDDPDTRKCRVAVSFVMAASAWVSLVSGSRAALKKSGNGINWRGEVRIMIPSFTPKILTQTEKKNKAVSLCFLSLCLLHAPCKWMRVLNHLFACSPFKG